MGSRLLNLCGLYIGPENELVSPAPDNQEGFWENLYFVELNEQILASLGGGWDLPPSAPNGWELRPEMIPLRMRAVSLIQRFSSNEPWGWKDPRNSLTFPFWKRLIPNLKVVVCLRHPLEVAESLYKRGYSSDAFTLKLWLTYNQRLLSLVAPEDRIVTHYNAYFVDTQAELRRVLRFLTMSVSEETIDQASFSTLPGLRHQSVASSGLPQANLSSDVLQCYMEMCAEAGPICQMALGSDIFSENGEIRHISQNRAENGDELRQLQAELGEQEQTIDNPGIAEKEQAIQGLFAQLAQETSRVQTLERKIDAIAAASIAASPNPIQVSDGSSFGETAISYTFLDGADVEVRVGSPDGPLFARPSASGTATTGKWVRDGTIFFLQDVTGGKPLAQEHTLASVTITVSDEAALRAQLAEKEAQLRRITGSLGWRLLSRYGRIKYRYILPLLRLLRLLPSAIAQNQPTEGSHKPEDSKLAG
jgi:hypothetical protein